MLWRALVAPHKHLDFWLAAPHARRRHLLGVVMPATSVPALALLVRGVVSGALTAASILATSHLGVLLGTYEALAHSTRFLARTQRTPLSMSQCRALASLMCAPVWLSGSLYLLPEEPQTLFYTSRLLMAGSGVWGTALLWQALPKVGVTPTLRGPLWLSASGAHLAIYACLFACLGIAANCAIWLLGGL